MQTPLPSPELHVSIDVIGEETKQTFKGDFVFRRLTIREKIEMTGWSMKLSGPELPPELDSEGKPLVDEDGDIVRPPNPVKAMYGLLGALRFGVVSAPDWWINSDYGLNLVDFNVITALADAKKKAEKAWVEEVISKAATVKVNTEAPEDGK